MDEISLLKTMWKAKTKRKEKLIVPQVTFPNGEGSLNNDKWSFVVPYAFREALDIKYEERKKDKKPYKVWTQGPIINFKEGDLIQSKCESKAVQVRFSNQMGWDAVKKEMYEGVVNYKEFKVKNNKFTEIGEKSCSQMQFLTLLIYGTYTS